MKAWILFSVVAFVGCNAVHGEPRPGASASASSAPAIPVVDIVPVVSKPLDTTSHLEAELAPFESVSVYARANGFVSRVLVDRGSRVKKGQLLLTVVAPELNAQRAEAQAKLQGDKSTYERLLEASKTPGAVAAHEVELALAGVQADQARLDSLRSMEQYLTVTASFDGVVTERNVHPGALVGPQSAGGALPMLRVEQVQKLRLTVAVPENLVGAIAEGMTASFSVRAFPGVKFSGVTTRVSRTIDPKTRTMAVELDVDNADGRLAPGMFADVLWPVKRTAPSLFVPPGAIVQSTERTFVIRIKDDVVEQVAVQRGAAQGDLVEVFGALKEGDPVARRGSEELRAGTRVEARSPKPASSGQ